MSLQLYTTACSRIDVTSCVHCCRRYVIKVVSSFEKRSARYLTDLARLLKVPMKEFNLERLLQASSPRLY